jgi:hypothetical protein
LLEQAQPHLRHAAVVALHGLAEHGQHEGQELSHSAATVTTRLLFDTQTFPQTRACCCGGRRGSKRAPRQPHRCTALAPAAARCGRVPAALHELKQLIDLVKQQHGLGAVAALRLVPRLSDGRQDTSHHARRPAWQVRAERWGTQREETLYQLFMENGQKGRDLVDGAWGLVQRQQSGQPALQYLPQGACW